MHKYNIMTKVSPHVQIYKFPIAAISSITNRITGLGVTGMYIGLGSSLLFNKNVLDLYDKAHTPLHWHDKLFKYARSLKIEIFSTPFDESAVDFLEKLNCPFYKVASFEMTDLPLIKKIAKKVLLLT